MRHCRPVCVTLLPVFLAFAAPATAAPWWYVGRGIDRVVFIDARSIERDGNNVTYWAKTLIRQPGDPVAMTLNFMQADCTARKLGWAGLQSYGRDEAVIDASTRKAKLEDVRADTLENVELGFVCMGAKDREASGFFPLAIDDASFTDALLAQADLSLSPRELHDRMAADPGVVMIRSTAPDSSTFGQIQTVKLGQPLVPPRDYSKGAVIPDPADYPSIEVGRIYDIVYGGIKNGEIRFEVRGYSIDDLIHPGSGQVETADLRQKKAHVRDLVITIKQVLPDRITYSVAIEKAVPVTPDCPVGDCSETEVTTEPVTADAADTPR
ncbi:surface-adhesin E family protein [Sphingomonas sp.]|uniref:surface-adhesin E family protein n=1 Tax=Sphingomonas sp. TaxID=28214 RepID=UPI003D6D4D07